MQPIEENPLLEFGGYWNFINLYIIAIGKLFSSDNSVVNFGTDQNN